MLKYPPHIPSYDIIVMPCHSSPAYAITFYTKVYVVCMSFVNVVITVLDFNLITADLLATSISPERFVADFPVELVKFICHNVLDVYDSSNPYN